MASGVWRRLSPARCAVRPVRVVAAGGVGSCCRDLKVAALFLTRFPIQVDGTVTMRDLAAAVYAFPLMGAAVGLLGGLAFAAAAWLGLPSLPAALLAIVAMLLATGALHEDGLADTADGLGAGARSRAGAGDHGATAGSAASVPWP